MSGRNRVVRSIETPAGERCVDIFVRPDGRFGFAEYRRDVEDPRGWHPAGDFGDASFASAGDAFRAARRAVAWLGDVAG